MMRKGSPSMIALLGLLAVAGYQNRDKLSGLLNGSARRDSNDPLRMPSDMARGSDSNPGYASGSSGGVLDDLRGMMGGPGTGGILGGLSELLGRFTNPVQSAKARTWVDTGPNGELAPGDLEEVLDDETLADLSQKTGLSRSELLSRLSVVLPDAVDQFTPKGRMPTEDEQRGMA